MTAASLPSLAASAPRLRALRLSHCAGLQGRVSLSGGRRTVRRVLSWPAGGVGGGDGSGGSGGSGGGSDAGAVGQAEGASAGSVGLTAAAAAAAAAAADASTAAHRK